MNMKRVEYRCNEVFEYSKFYKIIESKSPYVFS